MKREKNERKTKNHTHTRARIRHSFKMPEHNIDAVSKEWLQSELRSPTKSLIVLDCRSSNEFQEGHIRSAVNFSIPSLILKRLATGKIDLTSTIKCRDLKQRIQNAYTDSLFVLYNDVSYEFDFFFTLVFLLHQILHCKTTTKKKILSCNGKKEKNFIHTAILIYAQRDTVSSTIFFVLTLNRNAWKTLQNTHSPRPHYN